MGKNKVLFILAAASLLSLGACGSKPISVSSSPTSSSVASSSEEQGTVGLVYTLSEDGKSYSVTGYKGTDVEIVIPSHYQGLPVVEIGEDAFYFGSITNLIMPDSVTRIGKEAFFACSDLDRITFSKNLTTIGDYAFKSTSFTSLVLPSSLTEVGKNAFSFGGNMAYNIQDGIEYLPSESNPHFLLADLADLSSIVSPSIAADTELICDGTFGQYRNLTNFSVDSASTKFSADGKALFNKDKTVLVCYAPAAETTYTIPSTVTRIQNWAFYGDSELTSVVFPASLTTIGAFAFNGCLSLGALEFPSTLASIGDQAFGGCRRLTNLVLPAGVTSIGEGAFVACVLTSISVDSANVSFVSDGKALYNKDKTELFQYATSLAGTSYTLPDSLIKIGMGAFCGSASLVSVAVPDSLVKIGMEAFADCAALTSIALPKSVASIGKEAFVSDKALASITVDPANVNFTSDGKALYNKDKTKILQYAPAAKGTSYELPASLTVIDALSFCGAKALTSLTLPSSLTFIGDSAFYNCMGLTTLTYLGSKADWAKVSLHWLWKSNSSLTSIACSDGTVTL